MTWLAATRRRKLLPASLQSRPPLCLESMEDRTVPAIVVTGTNGPDTITANYAFDAAANQHRGNIVVNGKTAYTFVGDIFNNSIYLPDQLRIDALGGNDTINLVLIRDTIDQSKGIIIHGGAGNDTILGSSGHDEIYGDAGADSLNSYVDEDTIVGDDQDVLFDGGGGLDLLKFDNYAGTLRVTGDFINMNGNKLTAASGKFVRIAALDATGSNGADTFDFDQFPSFLVNVSGKGGNDTIRVKANRGAIDGGAGADTIVSLGTSGDGMQILGGAGNDTIRLSGFATVDGGAGDDDIDARSSNSSLVALGGDGNDTIRGNLDFGNRLEGGAGNDTLTGSKQADQLTGGPGRDDLNGGGDDDTFYVDGADDRWVGGKGIDTVYVEGNYQTVTVTNTTVTIDGNAITATGLEYLTVTGTAKNDTLDASKFGGYVSIFGLDGNDLIRGGAGGSNLEGGGGNDILFGSAAADYLYGGPGADQLTAGAGDDQLIVDVADTLVSAGAGEDFVVVEVFAQNIHLTDTSLTVNGKLYTPPVAENVFFLYGGTPGADVFDATGYTGDVNYSALEGSDRITTGSGNDYVHGGDGNDTIATGDGDDYVEDYFGVELIDAGGGNNVVFSYEGNDTITTGDGDDVIDAGNGDDVISSNGGNDTVYGGSGPDAGNNFVDAGAGDDSIIGGGGNDTLLGGAGFDVLLGDSFFEALAGDDVVRGGDDSDTVIGGAGADELYGDGGDDTINLELIDTVVNAGDGYDYLGILANITTAMLADAVLVVDGVTFTNLEAEDITISGTNAADTIDATGYSGALTYRGQDGNDFIQTGTGRSTIEGGAGDDTVLGGSGGDSIYETTGNDSLDGGGGGDLIVDPSGFNETITGGAGNDTIVAGGLFPTIDGGPDDDTITGSDSADSIFGGDGNDVVMAGGGGDTIFGGAGADAIDGGADDDVFFADGADTRLIGGGGVFDYLDLTDLSGTTTVTDTALTINGVAVDYAGMEALFFRGGETADVIDASGFTGFITILGNGGNDWLIAGSGGSNLLGQDGNDTLTGGAGSDNLYGDGFDDSEGFTGDDELNGGDGNDFLRGGAGLDTLLGGAGADVFVPDADPVVLLLEMAIWDFDENEDTLG